MSEYRDNVVFGKPPAGMRCADETARILGIDKRNVCGVMRRYGFKGSLYTTSSANARKAYYNIEDIRTVKEEQSLKHNSDGPVVAFNNGVKKGHVYRFKSIWVMRRELKRKFGVSITIRQCHEMLQNGTSCEGWFVDEGE